VSDTWPRVVCGLVSTPLAVVRLDSDLPMPSRAHAGDAGVDLFSAQDVELAPGQRALVPTGIAVAIPFGMVGLVHPRSGLAARIGLSIVNSPGTIDAGYRGEVKVALINLDPREPIVVHRGDRIAQLLVQRVELPELVEVASFHDAGLADTTRGDGGHGSSGGHASL
jgi:dUTP pyrophosphatase